jgi:hypothetical protein
VVVSVSSFTSCVASGSGEHFRDIEMGFHFSRVSHQGVLEVIQSLAVVSQMVVAHTSFQENVILVCFFESFSEVFDGLLVLLKFLIAVAKPSVDCSRVKGTALEHGYGQFELATRVQLLSL